MMKETRSDHFDNRQRSVSESPERAPGKILGRVILIFVLFLLLRLCISVLLVMLTMTLAHMFPSALMDALLVTEGGEFVDFTGNARVVITGISFAVCGAFVFVKAQDYSKKYTIIKDDRPLIVFLAAVSSVFLAAFLNLLMVKTGIMQASEEFGEVAKTQYSCIFIIGIIVYGIISPVCEELLFRGVIYNGLKAYLTWKPALLLTSVLFAVYHGNGVQGFYVLLMSIYFIYVYERSGSFKVPVLMHAAANIAAYTLTYLCDGAFPNALNVIMIVSAAAWLGLFALIFVSCGKKEAKASND